MILNSKNKNVLSKPRLCIYSRYYKYNAPISCRLVPKAKRKGWRWICIEAKRRADPMTKNGQLHWIGTPVMGINL